MSLLVERVTDRFPADDGNDVWAIEGTDGAPPRLEGWAVTYADRPNRAGRILVPGAFRDSLKKMPTAKNPLPMGYEHSTFGGTNPIGAWWTARDDGGRGVFLSDGRVSETSLGRDVAVLLRDRALNGLSVGFRALDGELARPGETKTFKTMFGSRAYTVPADEKESWMFVTKGELLETSVVASPADEDARLTKQALAAQALQALPGLDDDASWDDVAYSMALLQGGRGAAAFADLPLLERIAMYQRLEGAYLRLGKTPPPFDPEPDFRTVQFAHDEREVFAQRYVAKTLSTARAGIRGSAGPLSRDGCAMLIATVREVVPQRLGQLSEEQRHELRDLVRQLEPHLIDDTALHQRLGDELRAAIATTRS